MSVKRMSVAEEANFISSKKVGVSEFAAYAKQCGIRTENLPILLISANINKARAYFDVCKELSPVDEFIVLATEREGLLRRYIKRHQLSSGTMIMLIKMGCNDLVRQYIELYPLDVEAQTRLIEEEVPELHELYAQKWGGFDFEAISIAIV